jgi:hypothetical protein
VIALPQHPSPTLFTYIHHYHLRCRHPRTHCLYPCYLLWQLPRWTTKVLERWKLTKRRSLQSKGSTAVHILWSLLGSEACLLGPIRFFPANRSQSSQTAHCHVSSPCTLQTSCSS